MKILLDREALIKAKRDECEKKIGLLHNKFPRLKEIEEELGQLSLERIKVAILIKDSIRAQQIDKEVALLIKEKKFILKANSIPLSIYEPQWNCPKCQDKGYLEPGVICQCYQQERIDCLFKQSGITGNMKSKRFDNFDSSYYNDPISMDDKVKRCREFVHNLAKGKSQNNFLFTGAVGRGKTHLSLAIANEALLEGCTVIYYRIEDLLDAIRQYKYENDHGVMVTKNQLGLLKQADLLIIDDLGVESLTPFAENQIRMIIEDRNNLDKPWIINSNLNVEELQKTYGQRITDRIIEKSYIFSFEAPISIREILRRKDTTKKNEV